MKKLGILIFTFILLICSLEQKNISAREHLGIITDHLSISSPSAILIEFTTGTIIYEKNSSEKMYPASMTKMMAMYLFLEKIDDGTYSFEDTITVSAYASSMGGSQIFLKENEKMSFKDLFKAVTIASANDAVVALAEYTYGSIEEFISEMNNQAYEFGMTNTNFINTTGFHDPNHYTTAHDMSILARKLLTDYGETILSYTSIYDTYLRENSSSPFWLVNTNKMIKTYQGMDGLKTGYTSDSGFNLTATATRNGMRLISVVMGAQTSQKRNSDTATMLDLGFNNYKVINIYNKNDPITTHTFESSKYSNTEIVAKENVTYLIKKNESLDNIKIEIKIDISQAPVRSDQIIGTMTLTNPNSTISSTFNLYAREDVPRLNFIDILKRYWMILLA